MRDYQEVIMKFVKIVERYPELYDSSHVSYRTRHAELAWDKIAESVTTELKEQCTVEEIKTKWKGIRSSFIRFKNKLQKTDSESTPCRKYYLYDSLKFLEPFTKPKTHPKEVMAILKGKNVYEESDDDSTREEFTPEGMDSWAVTVKSEVDDESENICNAKDVLNIQFEDIKGAKTHNQNTEIFNDKAKKRKFEGAGDASDSEDLQFFKSILPDIKDFSVKEKRKLKMAIFKMIDEIEDSRLQINPVDEVTSTKIKR